MCHQNFYQPSEKINIHFQCGECWGYLFSLIVSQLRCFDKFLCHKMQKFVLIKMDFFLRKYFLKQSEYPMLQSRVSEGLFKLNL